MSETNWLSLGQMMRAIAGGEIAASEVWSDCTAQIARHDGTVRAFLTFDTEGPRSCTASGGSRPFHALPLAMKDTIDVVGMAAERGSSVWRGRMPEADAACVRILEEHGLEVLGKTVTTEFAYFTPGATTNPHHPAHTPGGSSSGSAAAVAAGMVPIALGTQTAGSTIRPASYCGVAAYVATVGRCSLRGVMPLAPTFDTLGAFARDVEDLQILEAALNRAAPASAIRLRAPATVLAIDGSVFGEVTAEMKAAFEGVLAQLERRQVRIVSAADLELDASMLARWPALHEQLMAIESAQTLAFEYSTHRDRLSPALRTLIEQGLALPPRAHDALSLERETLAATMAAAMSRVDCVIAPAAGGSAPAGLAQTGRPEQSRPWQLLGLPQVALPAARTNAGLPLGVQLVGQRHRDRALLEIAGWLQEEVGYKTARPATVLDRLESAGASQLEPHTQRIEGSSSEVMPANGA